MIISIVGIYGSGNNDKDLTELIIEIHNTCKQDRTQLKEVGEATGITELLANSMFCKVRDVLTITLELEKFITFARYLLENTLVSDIDFAHEVKVGYCPKGSYILDTSVMINIDTDELKLFDEGNQAIKLIVQHLHLSLSSCSRG